jgi:hypothetical protein
MSMHLRRSHCVRVSIDPAPNLPQVILDRLNVRGSRLGDSIENANYFFLG